MIVKQVLVVVAGLFLLAGCSTVKTNRVDVAKPTDLSGQWNDTDARLVAEAMIKDCLENTWVAQFNGAENRVPVVIIGNVKNKTYEHIASDIFVDSLQKALLASGKVRFVADKEARQELREERKDQQDGNTEPSTITLTGHETGADFMLQGAINEIKEAVEEQVMVVGTKKSTSYYQVTLELVNLRNNEKVWIGQKDVKKAVERKKVF